MQNNPFGPQPLHEGNILNPFGPNPSERYPSIAEQNSAAPDQFQSSQPQYGYSQPQQQQYSQQQQPQYGQQQQQYMQMQQTGSGFRPSSSFGQQLEQHMTGTYGPGPAQNNHAMADLDPYSSLGNTNWANPQQPQQHLTPQPSQPVSLNSYAGKTHPREVVKNRKQDLENWNTAGWKSLDNSLKDVQTAWEKRKQQVLSALDGQGGRNLNHEEMNRFQSLLKDADSNIDVIVAAMLQISEVETGYRHSTDAASRARVRTALNESLRSIPDWPEDLYTGPAQPSPSRSPMPQLNISSPPPQQMSYQQTGYGQTQTMNQQNTGYQQQQPGYQQAQQQGYQQPQQTGYQQNFQQQSGYQNPQQTGFQQQPMQNFQQPQQTGIQSMYPQQTGYGNQGMQPQQTGFYPQQQGMQQGMQGYPQSWNPI